MWQIFLFYQPSWQMSFVQHTTGLSFCSQCLAGQLLAPIYFWRVHKYSTKILCSSPPVLELKAVGGSRTDFCLELEQLLHLQAWDSPGLVWVSCLTSGMTGILCRNGTLPGLDQRFWPQVHPQGSQCSHVSAAFTTLELLVFPWGMCDNPDLTVTPWKGHRDDHLPHQQLLNPVDLLLCPTWGFQHREA